MQSALNFLSSELIVRSLKEFFRRRDGSIRLTGG